MGEPFRTNALTPDESARFERDGFLVLEGALRGDRLAGLVALADELERGYYGDGGRTVDRPSVRRGRFGRGRVAKPSALDRIRPVPLGRSVEFHDVLLDDRVLELVDHELTLPKIAGVLGWNIAVYLATLALSPPVPDGGPTIAEHVALGWHQDSSRVNDDLPADQPRPRLSAKVAFFLSDITHDDGGNMWVVPGSHLGNELPADAAETGMPLRVPAGAAVLFDRRIWHSASPNRSDRTRKVVFMGYAYRWLRTHDDLDVAGLWAGASPLRRQLLGWAPDSTSRYAPEDEDVPLRALVERPVRVGAGSAPA